jgi:hypothetical protein
MSLRNAVVDGAPSDAARTRSDATLDTYGLIVDAHVEEGIGASLSARGTRVTFGQSC